MKKYIVVLLSLCIFGYSLTQLYKLCTTTAPDFTVYYQSTQDVIHHANPYGDNKLFTAFNYPLITTIFFLPLMLLPQSWAQCIFLVLSYLCLFGCIYLTFKILKQKLVTSAYLSASALALLAFPTKFTLGMGQINFIALFLLLLFFWRYQLGKRDTILWFILACLCKPILLFMVLFVLFRKKLKEMVIAVGILGLLGMFYPYVFGLQDTTLYYLQHVIPGLVAYSGREIYYNQGISGFVARLTSNLQYRWVFTTIVTLLVGMLGLFGSFIYKKLSDPALFSILLTLLVIVDGLSWQHHFVFLLFPFAFAYFQTVHLKNNFLLGLWILAYLLVSFNIKSPQVFMSFPSVVLLSHVFYGALILLGLQMSLQRRNMHSR